MVNLFERKAKKPKANILIVEDERIISLEIRLILQKLGYNVIAHFPSGEDLIEKVHQIRPDLILMDIHLAGEIDGIQTIEKIQKTLDVPVIYMTAYSDPKTRTRAEATDPHHFLVKPIPMKILEEIIPAALARKN